MISAATRDQQALDCLEASDRHRASLLAVARRLTGNEKEGEELLHRVLLNCHDAIQRNGFAGGRYEFYLLASLKNEHYRQSGKQLRTVRLEVQELAALAGGQEAEAPDTALSDLAQRVAEAGRQLFSFPDRLLLRLQAEGFSLRQIKTLTSGQNVRKRLDKMKATLRELFRQDWDALGE